MIDKLNRAAFTAESLLPFSAGAEGADRAGTVAQLAVTLHPMLGRDCAVTQYASPSVGGVVTVVPYIKGQDVHVIVVTDVAAFLLALPAPELCLDGQSVLVSTTGATSMTIGAPTNGPTALSLPVFGFARLKWDQIYKLWRRIG